MFMNYKIIFLIKNKQKVNNKLILHVYYFSLFLEVVVYDFYNNKEQGLINYQVPVITLTSSPIQMYVYENFVLWY